MMKLNRATLTKFGIFGLATSCATSVFGMGCVTDAMLRDFVYREVASLIATAVAAGLAGT